MLTKAQNNVISYSGAIAVHLATISYFGRSPSSFLYSIDSPLGSHLSCAAWLLHFARRALESAFLEKHSLLKVPLPDSLGEFAYYWIFAAWFAFSIATSRQLLPSPVSPTLAFCGWTLAEFANFYTHLILSRTLPKNGRRVLPQSPLFCVVCCPHYLAEILSWTFFVLCCPSFAGIVFTAAGTVIMTGYALERHRKYAASDAAFARSGRMAIVPFVL
jgi:hypothetical protein